MPLRVAPPVTVVIGDGREGRSRRRDRARLRAIVLQADGGREVADVAEVVLRRPGVVEREEVLRRPRDGLVAQAVRAERIEAAERLAG